MLTKPRRANVSFLSIPEITPLQRTASLVSTMFSTLSIASGLYHVWHHRSKLDADILDAVSTVTILLVMASIDNMRLQVKYVYHVQGPRGQGERDCSDPVFMSFFLAVPVASLLWAMLCFSVALVAFCVQGSSRAEAVVLVIVVAAGLLVSGLCALVLSTDGRMDGCIRPPTPDI